MYYIALKLKVSCTTEFKKQLLERGFSIASVGILSLERTTITNPNMLPFTKENSRLECIANFHGDCNFPDPEILNFLYAHRQEIIDYNFGSLPF